MDFGSEFILADDGDDQMEVTDSDDEYDDDDEGVAGFECEIMDKDGGPVDDDPPVKGERKSITTNTLKIELAKIDEASDQNLAENFATKCNNPDCGAFFSNMDEWNKTDNSYTWKCKFCTKEHPLPAGFEEKLKNLPTKYDVCYEHADTPAIPIKDYKIIFVIDISGSMGRPMQVPKKEGKTLHKLWIESQDQKATDPNKDPNSDPNNDSNKVVIQEGMEVTWLQTVQASVIDLIQEMSVNQPERRIGLVTFHDIVTIHKEQKIDLVGADLDNKATALSIGEKNSNLEPVSKTKENLTASLRGLADGGRTALGPALLVALGMVKDSRGSRIIVCTDGASNIGIGKLEEGPSKEDEKFYQQITNKAILAGASISIISFDRCELKVLEKLARNTGGTLDIVQPTDLEKPIRDELSKETIATNVMVTFLVNKDLYVNDKKRDVEKNSENKSSVSPVIGNVTKTGKQTICFEFAFRNPSQVKPPQQQQLQQPQTMGQNCNSCNPSCHPPAINNTPSQNLAILGVNTTPIQPEYPFQIQITYKDREDRTLTRVWTKNCPITKSLDVAQKSMNPDVTVTSFVQKSAKEILEQKQKIQHSELKRRATNLINEAKSHRINDNISSNQELLEKLDRLIETLEELAISGLSDEVSAMLSSFAGQS